MELDNRFKEVKIRTIIGIHAFFLITYFLIVAIVSILTNASGNEFNGDFIHIAGAIITMLLCIALIHVFKPTKKSIKFLYNDFKLKIQFKEIITITLVILCLMAGGKALIIAISYYFSPHFASSILKDSTFEIGQAKYIVIFDIICYVISPIIDELTFRAVLFKRLSKKNHSIYIGMIISSIIYGTVGGDISEIIGTILLGIINCILYIKYENVLVPLLISYINNVICLVFISNFVDKAINLTLGGIGKCLEGGTIIFVIGIILFIKFIKANKVYIENKFFDN